MVLEEPRRPLHEAELPDPVAGPGQVVLRVAAGAVCRTDLHIVDGELAAPKLPLVPGHQIVGRVAASGDGVTLAIGERVGVPWLGWTCGECRYCRNGRENLCDRALFTGYQIDGGYGELAVADARFCVPIPEGFPDTQAAPLLCAGLIGYRSLRLAGDGIVEVEPRPLHHGERDGGERAHENEPRGEPYRTSVDADHHGSPA